MPAKKTRPTYRRHTARDQAVIDVYDHNGRRTRKYLNGPFDSAVSWADYDRYVVLLAANGGRLPPPADGRHLGEPTVNDIVLRFMEQKVAIDFPSPHKEFECFRQALKPLARFAGTMPAHKFDAKALRDVRETMISGKWMNNSELDRAKKFNRPVGWCLKNINKSGSRIRSAFRWAVSEKLVPASVIADLQCLPPLKAGRPGVRETAAVEPVEVDVVEKTIPHLPPLVADMVRIQLLTGSRPGEVCVMRTGEIDRSGPVWLYTPSSHKTKHRGHKRAITIGPQAQLVLRKHLKDDPTTPMFSAAYQECIIKEVKRKNRKSKVQPSQIDRSKQGAKRKPGAGSYDPHAYNNAIVRACKRAGVVKWHAHQLRHTAALMISRECRGSSRGTEPSNCEHDATLQRPRRGKGEGGCRSDGVISVATVRG